MEIELYKATPKGWSEEYSYLILKKLTVQCSYGTIQTYEVVKRWSAQGYGKQGVFTNSLNGVQYAKNELNNLIVMPAELFGKFKWS